MECRLTHDRAGRIGSTAALLVLCVAGAGSTLGCRAPADVPHPPVTPSPREPVAMVGVRRAGTAGAGAQLSQVRWVGPYQDQLRRQQAERLAWEQRQQAARELESRQRLEAGVVWQDTAPTPRQPQVTRKPPPAQPHDATAVHTARTPTTRPQELPKAAPSPWLAAQRAIDAHTTAAQKEQPPSAPPIASEDPALAQTLLAWSRAQSSYDLLARQYDQLEVRLRVLPDGKQPDEQDLALVAATLSTLHNQMRQLSGQSIGALDQLARHDPRARGAVAGRMAQDPRLPAEVRTHIASLLANDE